MTTTIEHKGVVFEVGYDYQPEEMGTLEHPYIPESIYIYSVKLYNSDIELIEVIDLDGIYSKFVNQK